MIMRDGGLPLHEWVTSVSAARRLLYLPTIVVQILAVLVYLESMGMSHGDLKPSNILISRQLRVRVIDWGGVCFHPRYQTNNCCTVEFAAPELGGRTARNSPAADVFSLGLIIRFLVYARFESERYLQRQCQRLGRVPILDLPEAIDDHALYRLIRTCQPMLEKDPRKRPSAAVIYAWPQFVQHHHGVNPVPSLDTSKCLPDPLPVERWSRFEHIKLQDRVDAVTWLHGVIKARYPLEFIVLAVQLMDEYLILHAPRATRLAELKPIVLASYLISHSLFNCALVTAELTQFGPGIITQKLGADAVSLLEAFRCRVYRRMWTEAVGNLDVDRLLIVLTAEAALRMTQLERLELYESLLPASPDPVPLASPIPAPVVSTPS
jgi:hypothetical protein